MEEVKKIDTELENLNLELTEKDIQSGEKKLRVLEGKKEVTIQPLGIDDSKFIPGQQRRGKYKIKDLDMVERIIVEEYGLKTRICQRLNITMQTFTFMLERHEQLQKAFHIARDRILDIAESALVEKVKAKDIVAVTFLLKTVGKSRGYSEKIEISKPEKPIFNYKKKEKSEKS